MTSVPGLTDALERVVKLAGAVNRSIAVIGGTAMILRVRARPTRDVDVVIQADLSDVPAVLEGSIAVGFRPAIGDDARALAAEGLIQLGGPEPESSFGADLIFVDSPYLARVVARATNVNVGRLAVPVATVEDLLLLKLEANRPIDLDDAIAIKDAFEETLDRRYLAEQGDLLGLRRGLEVLLGPLA